MESRKVPIGTTAKRFKDVLEQFEMRVDERGMDYDNISSKLTDGISSYGPYNSDPHVRPTISFQQTLPLGYYSPFVQPSGLCLPENSSVARQSMNGIQQTHLGNNTDFCTSYMGGSTGLSSANYSNSISGCYDSYHGEVNGNRGYVIPSRTLEADPNQTNHARINIGENEEEMVGYKQMFAAAYQSNIYHHLQQQPIFTYGNGYEQNIYSNMLMKPSAQTVVERDDGIQYYLGIPQYLVGNYQ